MPHHRLAWLAAGTFGAVTVGLAGCLFYLDPQCTDSIRNGSETDIDCGGSCRPCSVGHKCGSGADCESGTCSAKRCAPRPCENAVQDGVETDVDCGGGTCRRCSGGRHCLTGGDCFNGTCDPGTSSCHSLGNVSFAAPVTYPAGDKTYVMVSGDLDGDGDIDLAAANEQGDSVTVFLNRGDGTFDRVAPDFPTGAYPTGSAIADFNRDGIPDLVTANYHGNSVSVLLGVGDGTFQAPSHYPTAAGAETSNLAVGDLNGDGYVDVVASNPKNHSVSLFMGRSDGTLEPAANKPVGILTASAPYAVAIGDFDGDGKNDLAISEVASRTIIVRRGNGDGSFGPEVAHPGAGNVIIAIDVDRDGKLDLVSADEASSSITVLLGRGDGTFRDPLVSTTGPSTGPYTIAIDDFNLDGVPDVVTANFTATTSSVLLGIGDGRFELPISAGESGSFTYGVATGDFDRDGRPDFATCNAVSDSVTVVINSSN